MGMLRRNKKLWLALAGAISALLFLYGVYPISSLSGHSSSNAFSSRVSIDPPPNCDTFRKIMAIYRECLLNRLAKTDDVFNQLHLAVSACADIPTWQKFDLQKLNNTGETKIALLPRPFSLSDSCTEITLGVGNDILAEHKLRQLFPNCKFYGADPILESGKAFEEMGKYFQIAVGAESGIQRAQVLENDVYHFKDVETISFPEFLSQYAQVNQVDIMWMDNEGAEFEIFRRYLIDNVKINICQLHVEMHGPLAKFGMNATRFKNLVMSILERSPFLPIWSEQEFRHDQSFYINVEDRFCFEKYLRNRFCNV